MSISVVRIILFGVAVLAAIIADKIDTLFTGHGKLNK